MIRYVLVHVGFEKPTSEIMEKWQAWFVALADRTIENIGLRAAREISWAGTKDLPFGPDALTGMTIINAESMEEADALARSCPFITSIRIYEIAPH